MIHLIFASIIMHFGIIYLESPRDLLYPSIQTIASKTNSWHIKYKDIIDQWKIKRNYNQQREINGWEQKKNLHAVENVLEKNYSYHHKRGKHSARQK